MSTVLTFLRPDGKWAYAVSPGELCISIVEYASQEEALDYAKKAIDYNGWEPLRENEPPPQKVETAVHHSTSGVVTINKGVTGSMPLVGFGPLRLVKGEES
jgi:hypothetical protein